jgi:hypothetical protein
VVNVPDFLAIRADKEPIYSLASDGLRCWLNSIPIVTRTIVAIGIGENWSAALLPAGGERWVTRSVPGE